MKNIKITMRTTLLVLTVPLIIALVLSIVIFSLQMNSVAAESEEIFYNKLYTISNNLTNADRDFYQAYTAALNYYYLKDSGFVDQATLDGFYEDYTENMAQVTERVAEAEKICKTDPTIYTQKTVDGGQNYETLHGELVTAVSDWMAMYDLKTGAGDWATYTQAFEPARDYLSSMSDIADAWGS